MNGYPKRLIEVDLPIKRISAHARREKGVRVGHISAMHVWWARRPLAACRAVICAALWPDPADVLCPHSFREKASEIVRSFAMKVSSSKQLAETCSQESLGRWWALSRIDRSLDPNDDAHMNVLRYALFDFIADFANWDNSANTEYLDTARSLTQAAHEALGGAPGTKPLVVDPFAGGGSIPLEALRVGADSFASDLNPVPVLLNKVIQEYLPRYGIRLSEQVRKSGALVREQVRSRLAGYYGVPEGHQVPYAYLWARTVVCEGPACGYRFPLLRSLWLQQRGKNGVTLKLVPKHESKEVVAQVVSSSGSFAAGGGTSKQGAATCPACGYTVTVERVRAQLTARTGGTADANLLAVVLVDPKIAGKKYRSPSEFELAAFREAREKCELLRAEDLDGLSLIPTEELNHLRGFFNVVLYGMKRWGDLLAPRQSLLMADYALSIRKEYDRLSGEDVEFAGAVATCLALAAGKASQYNSSCCRWYAPGETVVNMFGRQAIPMVWDFAEAYPFNNSTGDFSQAISAFCSALENLVTTVVHSGVSQQSSATAIPLPDDVADAFVTDPPYYDAIPYADLSDYFYVWLRRTIRPVHPTVLGKTLSPKDEECVTLSHRAAMYRHKDKAFFEKTMGLALLEGRRIAKPSGVGVIVFAHKSTAGWEAMLGAVLEAGWTVTASWPIDTEMSTRLRARDSAVLASSVHLVCRPRENLDGSLRCTDVGDWREILLELPVRIHEWMPRLAGEGVVGADAIFSCLGPALEIFSRYSRVEKASGEAVSLKEYLEQVWAAVAREALNVIFEGADATGFEQDARITAMWFWTLSAKPGLSGDEDKDEEQSDDEANGGTSKRTPSGYVLEFDAARKIAQGLGAHLEKLGSVVEVGGETARLLPVAERVRYLFAQDFDEAPMRERKRQSQMNFLDVLGMQEASSNWGPNSSPKPGPTTLDRLHQSMVLFGAGRGEALKHFVQEEGIGNDQRFWKLAQALLALYPSSSDEKRWVEGVLARKKGLGL